MEVFVNQKKVKAHEHSQIISINFPCALSSRDLYIFFWTSLLLITLQIPVQSWPFQYHLMIFPMNDLSTLSSSSSFMPFDLYLNLFVHLLVSTNFQRLWLLTIMYIKIEITFIFRLNHRPIQLGMLIPVGFINILTLSADLVHCWNVTFIAQPGLLTVGVEITNS